MGFLIPLTPSTDSSAFAIERPSNADTPVVWRGLMVQKAVQQLLFDVDWRDGAGDHPGVGLDVLIVDLPPGTGDVPLTLGQLVLVNGVYIHVLQCFTLGMLILLCCRRCCDHVDAARCLPR